jgi:hypothetical protein
MTLGVKWSQVQILSARRRSGVFLGPEINVPDGFDASVDPNQISIVAETCLLAGPQWLRCAVPFDPLRKRVLERGRDVHTGAVGGLLKPLDQLGAD